MVQNDHKKLRKGMNKTHLNREGDIHHGFIEEFRSEKQVEQKSWRMDVSHQLMPMPMTMTMVFKNGKENSALKSFEDECPDCSMVYAVTPCLAYDPENIMASGLRDAI